MRCKGEKVGTILTSSANIGINIVAVAKFDVTSVVHVIRKLGLSVFSDKGQDRRGCFGHEVV